MEVTKITYKKDLSKIILQDILFIHLAEVGAMGCRGELTLVTRQRKWFTFSYIDGEISFDDVCEFFPVLKDFNLVLGTVVSVPKGWQHVYMGAGNHLLVVDEVYDAFYNEIKDINPKYKIYGYWLSNVENFIQKNI